MPVRKWRPRDAGVMLLIAYSVMLTIVNYSIIATPRPYEATNNRLDAYESYSANVNITEPKSHTNNRPPSTNGWTTIDVFYGKRDLLPIPHNNKWPAQAKQDKIVADLFRNKKGGYFIDLAAHQAVYLSNTFGLERELGWTGK
jgi:hypothetical protein